MMSEKKRRAKGAGSLRHLGGDRYQITVKVKGQRHSRVFRAKNGTEAERLGAGVRVELMKEIIGRDSGDAERKERRRWTVEKYADYYFEKWASLHLAATTRQRYRLLAKHQVIPYIGKKRMGEVTESDLMRLYAKLGEPGTNQRHKGQPLSPHTIWHTRTFIEALYTFAIKEKDFDTNPAKAAKPTIARQAKKTIPAVDLAETERLVSLAKETADLYPLIFLPARLGTRRGETLGLRWSDVDFERETLTVRRSVCQTAADGVQIKSTKTQTVRTIPLDPETLDELRALMTEQRKQRVLHGKGWAGTASFSEDHICANPDGSVMSPDSYTNAFRDFTAARKLTRITPHILRHAWVSQLIALGYDAVTISAMSGHSADVLLKTYAHAFDGHKREAINALAEARRNARSA